MPTPEMAKGWLQTIVPVLERAGPVTALILAACAWFVISGQQSELRRVHTVNRELFDKVESAYKAQLEMAVRCRQSQREADEPLTVPAALDGHALEGER